MPFYHILYDRHYHDTKLTYSHLRICLNSYHYQQVGAWEKKASAKDDKLSNKNKKKEGRAVRSGAGTVKTVSKEIPFKPFKPDPGTCMIFRGLLSLCHSYLSPYLVVHYKALNFFCHTTQQQYWVHITNILISPLIPKKHEAEPPVAVEEASGKAATAAKHTYDVGYKKWENFDVDQALKEPEGMWVGLWSLKNSAIPLQGWFVYYHRVVHYKAKTLLYYASLSF